MTLEQMVALNRMAEKVAHMGIRPPGKESYALAERLLAIAQGTIDELRAKFPKHAADALAGNVCHLLRVHTMKPIVEAAQAWVAELHPSQIDAAIGNLARLIQSVHVHNLVHEMPATTNPNEDPDHERDQ